MVHTRIRLEHSVVPRMLRMLLRKFGSHSIEHAPRAKNVPLSFTFLQVEFFETDRTMSHFFGELAEHGT